MKTEEMICELRRLEEAHKDDFVGTCETNWSLMCRDVANRLEELLAAQEPRVVTLEEVKQHNNQDGCVWFEQPTYNAVAAFVRQDEEYTEIISPYLLGEPINHGYMANRFYGKAWRCWTSRPTDEQREATPWERLN